jgi:hypothetical protein
MTLRVMSYLQKCALYIVGYRYEFRGQFRVLAVS